MTASGMPTAARTNYALRESLLAARRLPVLNPREHPAALAAE